MEKLVDQLTAFPSSLELTDAELAKQAQLLLANYLYKVPASSLASGIGGTNLLDLLNPATNSLPYIFVLAAKLDIGGRNALETNWAYIIDFLAVHDARQIKHTTREFRRVVEMFCTHASDMERSILAVKPLKKALLRSNPSQFSFMHTLFTRLCLQAKCYRDAIAVLDIDVFDFPSSKGNRDDNGKGAEVGHRDVLEYYLYGAILYMGVKRWRRAMDYLCHAIAAPGNSCSTIQVEAYKKFILVGLLHDGKFPQLPKSTTGSTSRMLKALSKPYEAFANAFISGDISQFRLEIESTGDIFNCDGNSGLAVQCIDVFRRMQIIALRDTYVTLGVPEIAQKKFDVVVRGGDIGSDEETERIILGMIERDEISATLSQSGTDASAPQTTVHFDSGPVEEARYLGPLEEQIARIVALNKQVKQMDRKLGLTKEYMKFLAKQSKASAGSNPTQMSVDAEMMEMDYAATWGDEDMEETMHDFDDNL